MSGPVTTKWLRMRRIVRTVISAPILFRLALHRRRGRVLELEPVLRAPRDPQLLRHGAFVAELAGMNEHGQAVVLPEPAAQ